MSEYPTPRFHPITVLPTITAALDEMVDDAEIQFKNLDDARDKPYVLDDATVERVIRCYSEQRTYVPLYKEQLARWAKLDLTGEQRCEVTRLQSQIEDLDHILSDILTLAQEFKDNTIEKLMAKDDAEVALDVLTGKLNL